MQGSLNVMCLHTKLLAHTCRYEMKQADLLICGQAFIPNMSQRKEKWDKTNSSSLFNWGQGEKGTRLREY